MTTYYVEGIGVIELGPLLGEGGEGRVFAVDGSDGLVAKIYSRETDPLRAEKIGVMSRSRAERLRTVAAWPLAPLSRAPGAPVCGFTMARVDGGRPVHALYTPKSRKALFPGVTWRFLVVVAANIARAFAVVHEHGLAVGDVNHENVLVRPDGRVVLIDCDTFHVIGPDKEYPCGFGVTTHTPPELQGTSLTGIVRTSDHDAFGLAVLVFQLLFLGRHPFSGRYETGDVSIEEAIAARLFAYGRAAEARGMRPPPYTPTLDLVTPELADMFEQAFRSTTLRLSADRWATHLESLAAGIVTCDLSTAHEYRAGIASCPWCEIEQESGASLWHADGAAPRASRLLDVTAVRETIAAIKPPPTAIPPASLVRSASQASPVAVAERRRRIAVAGVASGGTFVASVAAGVLPESILVSATMLAGIWFAGAGITNMQTRQSSSRLADVFERAEREWQALTFRLSGDATRERFDRARRDLLLKLRDYESLDEVRRRRLKVLERTAPVRQMQRYLEEFRVDESQKLALTRGYIAALYSYGIETAADVTAQTVRRARGINSGVIDRLLEWRAHLEHGFVFDPHRPLIAEDVEAIERDIERTQAHLEHEIIGGTEQLRQLTAHAERDLAVFRRRADTTATALAVASADREAQPSRWLGPAAVSAASLLAILMSLLVGMVW